MPLFECSKCKAVENTALSNYAYAVYSEGVPPLCSECDPAIGKWHALFDKRTAEQAGFVPDKWGPMGVEFLSPPGGWK